MSGLQRILKAHGRMIVGGVEWVWDYNKDVPRRKKEMSRAEWNASEKTKWTGVKQAYDEIDRSGDVAGSLSAQRGEARAGEGA